MSPSTSWSSAAWSPPSGPGLARPDGVEEVAADGRWLTPGLWDQHVHLGQWTLTRQRTDTAARHVAGGGDRPGRGQGGRRAGPARDRLGPPSGHLDARGLGDRARRGLGRHPRGPDRGRRSPRLAQQRRAGRARARPARRRRPRERVVRGLRAAHPPHRRRRHRRARLPHHPRGRGRARRGGGGRPRVRGRRGRVARALARRVRRPAGADGDVRRPARGRGRRRPAHRHAAGRGRRPAGDGTAQDHQRRLAQHPHRLVLRAVRRRPPAREPHRRRQPRSATSCRPCSRAPTCPGSTSPPTRSATRP